MTPLADVDLIDALCRNLAGRPAAVLNWRDLLHVRDHIDRLLSAEIDRRQEHDTARGGAS